jgi:hypothetical protein
MRCVTFAAFLAAAALPAWALPDGILPVAMTGDRTDYGEIVSLGIPARIEDSGAAFSASFRDGNQEDFCFFVPASAVPPAGRRRTIRPYPRRRRAVQEVL